MACRACKKDHSPMLTCQRAARMSNAQSNNEATPATESNGTEGKFDKVAYQREYMRKRRAEEKLKKASGG